MSTWGFGDIAVHRVVEVEGPALPMANRFQNWFIF